MKNILGKTVASIMVLALMASPAYSQVRKGTNTDNKKVNNTSRTSTSDKSSVSRSTPPSRSSVPTNAAQQKQQKKNAETSQPSRSSATQQPQRSVSNNKGYVRTGVSSTGGNSRTAGDNGNQNQTKTQTQTRNQNQTQNQNRVNGGNQVGTSISGTAFGNHRSATINDASVKNAQQGNANSGADVRQSNGGMPVNGNSKQGSVSGQRQNGSPAGGTVRSNSNVTKGVLSTFGGGSKNNNSIPADGGYKGNRDNGYHVNGHEVVRIPPRDRDFLSYDRPSRFYGSDHHYYGYRVNYLPSRYRRINAFGMDYYYYGGVYYRRYRGFYVVCRPPFGTVINDAIADALLSAVNFAFYYDSYRTYGIIDNNYRYIEEQNRIIASNNAYIANQYNSFAVNRTMALSSYDLARKLGLIQSYADANQPYYYQDGVFYFSSNGGYTVIVPPAGALVSSLPDDYDTLTMDNQDFYKVDDTVYRLVLISGVPYLEVLGQLYGRQAQKYDYYYRNGSSNGNDDGSYGNLW
jgi:hypothetical protein